MENGYHVPVLLREVIELLNPSRGGVYFDGTLGGGGHTEAILEAGASRVIGVDRDPEAIEVVRDRLKRFGERVELVHGTFADVAEGLEEPLAGALLDLGISSRHIDEMERGFSFRSGAPLDMRMQSGRGRSAADLLNILDETDLADIFYYYGEERRSRRLASEIVRARKQKPFETSDDLLDAMNRSLGKRLEAQDKARIFQALRIAVNEELSELDRALPALRDALAPEGVLVILSYHSLEDRRVKEAFREWSRACVCPPEVLVCTCRGRPLGTTLTKKPMEASEVELAVNPRARSAKLRAWRKAA